MSRTFFLDRGSREVEDVGHDLRATHILVASQNVLERGLKTLLDLLQDIGREILHRRNSIGYIGLHEFGQVRQDPRGLISIELRQNQCDGTGDVRWR